MQYNKYFYYIIYLIINNYSTPSKRVTIKKKRQKKKKLVVPLKIKLGDDNDDDKKSCCSSTVSQWSMHTNYHGSPNTIAAKIAQLTKQAKICNVSPVSEISRYKIDLIIHSNIE